MTFRSLQLARSRSVLIHTCDLAKREINEKWKRQALVNDTEKKTKKKQNAPKKCALALANTSCLLCQEQLLPVFHWNTWSSVHRVCSENKTTELKTDSMNQVHRKRFTESAQKTKAPNFITAAMTQTHRKP